MAAAGLAAAAMAEAAATMAGAMAPAGLLEHLENSRRGVVAMAGAARAAKQG